MERVNIEKTKSNRLLIIGIFCAIFVRVCCIPNKSWDYKSFLISWYDYIVQHGGWSALKDNFSDYSPPYLYWLVIASTVLAWLPKIVSIKLLGMIMDFVCAFFAYKLVKLRFPEGRKPLFAFLTLLLIPTVPANSALWGQCDVIYTTGLIACLYWLCVRRMNLALFSFGISIAFKLQAIFMIPCLIVLLQKRIIKWPSILMIPCGYFLAILPAWILGRPLKDILLIYFSQAQFYKVLTNNAPNLYQWIPNDFFSIMLPLGILLTLLLIIFYVLVVGKSVLKLTHEHLIQLAFTSVLFMPYFLPKMHDRYFYPADITSVIFSFYFPKFYWMPIILQVSSLVSYANGDLTPLVRLASIPLGIVVGYMLWHHYRTFKLAPEFSLEAQ